MVSVGVEATKVSGFEFRFKKLDSKNGDFDKIKCSDQIDNFGGIEA